MNMHGFTFAIFPNNIHVVFMDHSKIHGMIGIVKEVVLMKNIKKNVYGYVTIALALAMVVVTAFSFTQPPASAEGQLVTIS